MGGMQRRVSFLCLVLNGESPGLVRELGSVREQKLCQISEQGRYEKGFLMKYCTLGHDGVSGKTKRVRMLPCGSRSRGCTHINASCTSMVWIQQRDSQGWELPPRALLHAQKGRTLKINSRRERSFEH